MSKKPEVEWYTRRIVALEAECERLANELRRQGEQLVESMHEKHRIRAELAALKAPAVAGDEREAFEAEYVMTGDGFGDVYDAMWHAFQNGAAWQRNRPAQTVRMPPAPYMPEDDPSTLTDYERGEAQGRCDMWAMVKDLNSASPIPQPADGLVEALEHARLFIRNGVDLGYIQMPDSGTPDPAHDTLPKIEAALAAHRAGGANAQS